MWTVTITGWTVTITGADDDVDPSALEDLSREFPFVEWGILRSSKREGTPRYPSRKWVRGLGDKLSRLSIHLCGEESRQAQLGLVDTWYDTYPTIFTRIQINGYKLADGPIGLKRASTKLVYGETFILPFNDEALALPVACDAAVLPGGEVLFDPSGGRGVEPFRWATAPAPVRGVVDVRMGYAGGIGPDNVVDVLRDIGPVRPTWIDMESGVRTGDKFDLAKVRRVLEQVAMVRGG